jgi:integrase
MPRRTTQKEHSRACKLAGINGYTIHDHRHTAAVHLARAGMPLNLLMRQLGHSTIKMTMRYAAFHPAYSDMAEYFEKVGETPGLGLSGNRSGNTPRKGVTERTTLNVP